MFKHLISKGSYFVKSKSSSSPFKLLINNNRNSPKHVGRVQQYFHTSNICQSMMASSKSKVNFSSSLLSLGLSFSAFLVIMWLWDYKSNGIYSQILKYESLDRKSWEFILQNGKSDMIKLEGRILMEEQDKLHSFHLKPMEETPRSEKEILLIHYFLNCFNGRSYRRKGEAIIYSTHDFFIIRNRPLKLEFIDPSEERPIIVDFHLRNSLTGENCNKINENETFTNLECERIITGGSVPKFVDQISDTVRVFNFLEPNGLIWNKEETEYEKRIAESVLRNGQEVFLGGQFTKSNNGKLEFHCSFISHKSEQNFMNDLRSEMGWFEKLKLRIQNL